VPDDSAYTAYGWIQINCSGGTYWVPAWQ
jgi:hypothetical protein